MKTKNALQPITAADLLARRAPAGILTRFDREVRNAQYPEDSAAGDREIREAVAESLVKRLPFANNQK